MAIEQMDLDESVEPALLRELNEDQKARLSEQLDRYLCAMETGVGFDREQLSREHPDLSEIFSVYLKKLNALYDLGGNRSPAHTSGRRQPSAPGIPLQQLGDFRLLREIGRGGMGIVYEAHQVSLDRRVAIKLLPLASMLDENQIARFQNEAHAAGLLQHPNIVPVHSIGCERGIHFYVMQFIDGLAIDQWITERRQQISGVPARPRAGSAAGRGGGSADEWRTVVEWAVQVAHALHFAHENGVIHRDIKPSNLLLDREQAVWVTDFGLARCQTEVSLTGSGDLLGTLRYMSPEQACGKSALVDGRSDVYSLAATVYEMLVLRPVYDSDDAPTLLRQIEAHQYVSLRQLCPHLPRDLETVLNKAMARARDDRYETAGEFAEDLSCVLSGQPTAARPPTPLDRVVRWAGRHRHTVMVTLLVGLLGTVGLAIGATLLAAEKRVSDDNARRSERNAQLARRAVDDLGSQIAELLVDVPAAAPVRRHLLVQTLAYYERFAAGAEQDPLLREDLAITYGKIGSLYSEIGLHADALQALRKSEQLYAQFSAENFRNLDARLAWSISQNNLAEALHAVGKLDEAARYFAEAVQQQLELATQIAASQRIGTSQPSSEDVAVQLATTLNNRGLLLSQAGAETQAETNYVQALELLQAGIPAEQPAGEAWQLLATIRTNLSGLLSKSDPQRAMRLAAQAVESRLALLESEPSNAKLAAKTITSLNALGAAQAAGQQTALSVQTFTQAVDLAQQLLLRAPKHVGYRRDLVLSFNHLGMSYSRGGRLDEARQAFEQAKRNQQRLIDEFPQDAELQSVLGGVLNNLGFLQQQLGDLPAALLSFKAAVAAQRIAVELAPEVERYSVYLEKHLANIDQLQRGTDAT
ncbi:MAG: serine/threonine protein kinase [Planctomycetales bacterium]|nr:serine/threonine protein kinase [Planctomycetales bacterium]